MTGAVRCSALILAVFAPGCGDRSPAPTRVAISIFPVYDVGRRIAGERLAVDLMLPPGMFDHEFEPRPKDFARIAQARLVVLVGFGLDQWGRKLAAAAGGARVVELGPLLEPLTIPASLVTLHADEDEAPGADDPHVWLDPVRMGQACAILAEEFTRLDPSGAEGFRSRAAEARDSIARLHAEVDRRTRGFSRRSIVTFHGSWQYYAARYGLTVAAVVEPSPGREPTAKYVRDVLKIVRDTGVSALFSEPQLNRRPAEVIAEEAGVPLFELDALGGVPGRDSYEALLRYDTGVLEQALR
jgi:ABC-type Zn uptake system ZnuABC Zn-binding protein ZnuA